MVRVAARSGMTELQQALVAALRERKLLNDPLVEAAFLAVPRHFFLPDVALEKVYMDEAIPILHDEKGMVVSSSSQPSMMAMMLNQLELEPGHNVLEIGTATGYNAALMQHIVGASGNITSIEIDAELTDQAVVNLQRAGVLAGEVHVVQGDGALGYQPRAAYDRIISTVCVWDVPEHWVRQLKPRGILVTPIWIDGFQVSAAFRLMRDGSLYSRSNLPCGFVSLRGMAAVPEAVSKRVNGSGLWLDAADLSGLDTAAVHLLLSDDQELHHLGVAFSVSEYWYSFIPYLIVNLPPSFTLVFYHVRDAAERSYGLEGSGFALIGPGSACFVPFIREGSVYSFAGADAFMALYDLVQSWNTAGRPLFKGLQVRLVPLKRNPPGVKTGKLYIRDQHYLHIWYNAESGDD